MDKLLKSWELKLFSVCDVMTKAAIWCVLIQSIGDVCHWCDVLVGTILLIKSHHTTTLVIISQTLNNFNNYPFLANIFIYIT